MNGEFYLTATDPESGVVTARRHVHNAITRDGRRYLAGFLVGRARTFADTRYRDADGKPLQTPSAITHIAIGTGGGASARASKLGNELRRERVEFRTALQHTRTVQTGTRLAERYTDDSYDPLTEELLPEEQRTRETVEVATYGKEPVGVSFTGIVQAFFPSIVSTGYIREIGTFVSPNAGATDADSGILFSRALMDFDNKERRQDLTAEWRFTMSVSSAA